MTLKPWREIAVPHEDVLKGTFQQAEFAADLSRVHDGTATPEYQNPALFFQRTFITEGMRLLLDSVVKRLAGKGGDPVIQLQTAFGGGKTHTMLAVYHLVNRASGEALASDLAGVPAILDAAGVTELPRARIAVLDGIKLSPNQPVVRVEGDVTQAIRTLWGDLAWQLGKAEGYALVADADASGTSPGKAVLVTLLSRYAPCVILIDELVAYVRQFEEGKTLTGGSFDSNLSFVQALTEALKAVPTAVLLRETYKWMLAPMQEAKPGKGLSEIQWEHFQVNPGAPNLSQEIERVLKENELLITEWAPIHLAKVLRDWFWKDDVKEVSALNVWQQSCQQLYLPRLKDDTAFQHTMAMGTESQDFFGFAQGKEDGCYVGFSFDQRTSLILDSALLLIEPVAAAGYAELQRAAEEAARPKSAGSDEYAAG